MVFDNIRKFGSRKNDRQRAARHFNKLIKDVTDEDIRNLPARGSGR